MDLAKILRERELTSIRVQLEHGLRDNVLKSLDERGGAQELVRQQYSGRYPFELLQNANDAALDTGIQGRAIFLLTDTALIVADNGSGFGEKQVDAICSLGRSSKGPGTSVGHKGLGFKSVGEITDRPQVISRQTSFQFDGERVRQETLGLFKSLPDQQKFPVYAFPFSVEHQDLGADASEVEQLRSEGWTTVIRLPLREGVLKATVAAHVVECLLPRLLLFLNGVDHLELRGTHADFSVEVSRDVEEVAEHVLLEIDGRLEEWLIYRGEATPELAILEPMGEAWTEIDKMHIAVAVPLDGSNEPRVDESFPLSVYFPTEERPGLRFAVHAEWALSMDRRQLAATPEAMAYNKFLLEKTADFVASVVAIDIVKRTNASTQAVLALVPTLDTPTSGAGTQFRNLLCDAMAATPFLPVIDGTRQTPTNVRLLPRRLPSFSQAHAIADLDVSHVLRSDVEELEPLRQFVSDVSIGGEMGLREFLIQLRPPTRESIGDYYGFLTDCRTTIGQPLVTELSKLPSVLATNGSLHTPGVDTVFFPRMRGDSAIPENIPVPIAEMPNIDGLDGLLRELGVKSFEWRELIREFLIKILGDPDAKVDDRSQAMAGLRAYHRVRLAGSEDLAPLLAQVLLPARSSDGTTRSLRAGGELYFDSTWTGSEELAVIYGPFEQPDFLGAPAPADADSKDTELDFYRMLGVTDHPRLDEASPADRYGYMVDRLRHAHRGKLFEEWMSQPDVVKTAECPQGHPASQQLKLSIRLDRQLEITLSRDPARLLAFWNQMARRWGSVYEPAMEAVFRCVHGSHSGERNRQCESLFAYILRSRQWVPVDRGGVPHVVRPEEAWIDAQETPRRIKERIPRISGDMYKMQGGLAMSSALRLTDAGRPRVNDLLALLRSIAEESDDNGGTTREIEFAARYVQRTLNDVLSDESETHPDPANVRLLASFCGSTSFVARPPFADDPMLRDTWEQRLPVLAAESGLRKLARYLSLTKLDAAVVTSAVPYGEHILDPIFAAVRRKINGIKPYILALARNENSRTDSTVRPALKHLELIVCDQLVLKYEYEGAEVEREDALCYIAIRQEKRGRRILNLGTAYLELDSRTGQPHWFPLGRQLAQYMGVPGLSDAVTMLLTASEDDRDRMMTDRHIKPDDIAEARKQLRTVVEDDDEIDNVLDSLLQMSERDGHSTVPAQSCDPNGASIIDQRTVDEFKGAGTPSSTDESAVPSSPFVAPSVDYSSVHIREADPRVLPIDGMTRDRRGGLTGGASSKAPSISDREENNRVGKRGELIAYNAERRRLEYLGKNPDLAIWVARTDELSPFDIRSIDADDQVIYIEVKSTKGIDPSDPFYISHAELIEASFHRDRYYIYRVTNVDSATPSIARLSDPVRLVKEGKGRLLLAQAHMSLDFKVVPAVSSGDSQLESAK